MRSRALTTVLRFRHVLLWLWLGFMLARNGPDRGLDWAAFRDASRLLFGDHPDGLTQPGGLHVFANYTWTHAGPLGLFVAAFFRVTFSDGRFAAMLAMAALGPVLILLVERAATRARGLRDALDEPLLAIVILVSGAAFLRGWVNASWVYIHIEEGLVIAATAVTVWCVVTRRATLAGAAVGLSIASKLSGVLLFPLLACFPRRWALRAGAVAAGLAAVAWLPFFIADPGTWDAGKGTVGNFPASGLRVLGIESTGTPEWVRPTQVGLGLVLGLLAVQRGRWEGAVLVAVAARLALDPSTSGYYTAGIALGALIWDLAGRYPLPIWTPLIVATHVLAPRLAGPDVEGAARLAVAIAAIIAVLALPWTGPRESGGGPARPPSRLPPVRSLS